MRRNNRSKKPSKPGGKSSRDIAHLPQIKPLPVVRLTRRYGLTTAGTINCDHKDVLLAGGAMCTVVNTTLTALYSAAKIVRVQVWAPVSATAVPAASVLTNICLLWGGAASTASGSTQLLITDQTLSSVTPAYISSKPPRGSQASWWGNSDTVENLFQVFSYNASGVLNSAPAGTIIEITADYAMASVGTQQTLGVATGALGQIYYPTLDSSGSKVAYPLGLLSTV